MRLHFIVGSWLLSFAIWGCGSNERVYPLDGDGVPAGMGDEGKGGEKSPPAGAAMGETDNSGGGGDGPPAQLKCTESQVLDVGSELFSGTTTDAGDDIDASCFSGSGEDLAVEWVAPRSDYYRFTTAGSDYDAALALLDDSCDGAELACNSDSNEPEVEIVSFVEKGSAWWPCSTGKPARLGEVVLGIEAITCPDLDLTDEVPPIELGTQNQGDSSAACDGAGKSDRSLRFTPTEDGLYRFSATSDDFAAIVSVEEGPSCGGSVLGCGFSFREDRPRRWCVRSRRASPSPCSSTAGAVRSSSTSKRFRRSRPVPARPT